jgi:sialidase-1
MPGWIKMRLMHNSTREHGVAGQDMSDRNFALKAATLILCVVMAGTVVLRSEEIKYNDDFSQADLFVGGEGGYKTYRIPALVLTKKRTVLAICEARKNGPADGGDIDLILRRSVDNGKTWSDPILIWSDGEHTIGNPVPVSDGETGIVWLVFTKDNNTVYVTSSDDDGLSWKKPEDITGDVKPAAWEWYASGPGHGIQLKSGRLLIPCDHKEKDVFRSHVIYSDDHGKTWKRGGNSDKNTDEATAVELHDGVVYLNSRSNHMKGMRAFAISGDGGETFSKIRFEKDQVEPVCEASTIRFTDEGKQDGNRLLFSNPADRTRVKMTVKMSYDEARSWPVSKLINEGKSGYSDLVVIPDMTIGLLYERGEVHYWEKITFARFTLEWLTDGKDRIGAK